MSNDTYAEAKSKLNRKMVIEAYQEYIGNPAQYRFSFWKVIFDFIQMKVYRLEHQFKTLGTAETADDWAQDATIKVWEHLPKFIANPKSTPESFFSWIDRIAYHKRIEAARYLKDEKNEHADLIVTYTDDEGDYREDNPKVQQALGITFGDMGFVSAGVNREPRGLYMWMLPKSVQGVDRKICNLLAIPVREKDGTERSRTYAEAARDLNLSLSAVKRRMSQVKRGVREEHEQKDQHTKTKRNAIWETKQAEMIGGPRRGLDELRRKKAEGIAKIADEEEAA